MTASDAQIARAMAAVVEPAPGTSPTFSLLYSAVRAVLDREGVTAPMGDVKRIARAAGLRLTFDALDIQRVPDVRVNHPSPITLSPSPARDNLGDLIRRAFSG